jgi:ABC-type Fe3+/spermidine/putrescine transport system ATPase subunit
MSDERKTILELRDIRKSFGPVEVLKGVSARISQGDLATFVGPSGCGKTTLLRIIGGLTKPNSGAVVLDGKDISDVTPDKRGTQMCFQNYALFPHMTVAQNVGYGLDVHHWEKERIDKRVAELLQLVQLDGLGGRYIEKMSGGQQQRVALARALALEPKLLLLDEPLSNLDANLRVQMRATLLEIVKRVGITTVFVTHDQQEAMSISDRLFVMNKGNIEQVGSPLEIYQQPNSAFIAGFVGYVNILNGSVKCPATDKVECTTVMTEFGQISVMTNGICMAPGDMLSMVVRPEAIRIAKPKESMGDNEFEGRVKSFMYGGSMVKYVLDIGGIQLIADQFDPINEGLHGIGERCCISLPQNVHLLKG